MRYLVNPRFYHHQLTPQSPTWRSLTSAVHCSTELCSLILNVSFDIPYLLSPSLFEHALCCSFNTPRLATPNFIFCSWVNNHELYDFSLNQLFLSLKNLIAESSFIRSKPFNVLICSPNHPCSENISAETANISIQFYLQIK